MISTVSAQQTVGLFLNDSAAVNGYTLFAPTASTETYLIDNCGYLVNQWSSAFRPGQSAYLLEDGSLLRTARINSQFNSGGTGGRLERYDWEGNLTWAYNYSTDDYHQHHDIEPLPNGNVLILAWELISREEAIALGRDSATVSNSGLWPERIVEVRPVGETAGEIVWNWRLRDHFIQDRDSSLANFGSISAHPELVDINYTRNSGQPGGVDMIHANSIDYNPELDQIILSSRVFSEVWVIDHSTTTEEAATNSGGLSGRGGDLLYRWGNPRMYGRGTQDDQVFFGQHDARWIPQGYAGAGNIMVFNNGVGRGDEPYFSSVDVIAPPWNVDSWAYDLEADESFGPQALAWCYTGMAGDEFYASNISGSMPMANGHVLVCIGTMGQFVEVDPDGVTVWEYISPVGIGGPVEQGDVPNVRSVFRATKYPEDYMAFVGRDMTPGNRIELNPLDDDCVIYTDSMTTAVANPLRKGGVEVLGNPFSHELVLSVSASGTTVRIIHLSGVEVYSAILDEGTHRIPAPDWPPGIYIINIINQDNLPVNRKLLRVNY